MPYWKECREFYRQFQQQYHYTGSILPSSRGLARALASAFHRRAAPARILEVGPGTGAVTGEILRQLRPADKFDLVEINADFVEFLRKRFDDEPLWRARQAQTTLIRAPLQELQGEGVYDFLVSGLPLNNFPLALVREIFAAYRRLLKPGGTLSYFEYLAIRDLKKPLVSAGERRRLRVLGKFLERRIRRFQVREQWVFMNLPPAVARHFCFSR